jgi:ABC-type Zn2+ transport system substrate-binding protein/surface adhesin
VGEDDAGQQRNDLHETKPENQTKMVKKEFSFDRLLAKKIAGLLSPLKWKPTFFFKKNYKHYNPLPWRDTIS